MTIDASAAKTRLDEFLSSRNVPGRLMSSLDENEVTVTITEIPFVHHGMSFKSAVRFHFSMQMTNDGGFRTYWGHHSWKNNGADAVACKTEEASETHQNLDQAINWLGEQISLHAR